MGITGAAKIAGDAAKDSMVTPNNGNNKRWYIFVNDPVPIGMSSLITATDRLGMESSRSVHNKS